MSATTPRKTDMSTHNSPSKPTPRRVLADLTPKAINTPSKQTNMLEASEAMRPTSPLKQVQTLSPHVLADKENVSGVGALQAGRKRSINEVDGAENVEDAGRMFTGREMLFSGPGMDALAGKMESLVDTYDRDDRGSTTEPDTPPPEPMEEVINDSQASNQSFSNFVDWKECESQPNDQPPVPPPPPPAIVETYKATKADLLRLRLGFATYKLKTNQVNKSGSEILSIWEATFSSSDPLNASMASNATITSSTTSNQTVPSITLSQAREDSLTHVRANLDPGGPIPKLVGGPQLLPTAFSSRMILDYHMPSSPPTTLPECVSPEQVMSPTRPNYRTPVTRRVRDENEEEGEGEQYLDKMTIEERLQRQRQKRFEQGDLTSSVKKGNAADVLLELKLSGRR